MECKNITQSNDSSNTELSMEEFIKLKEQQEDQIDYQFIQRIIQELTQSCALPLPIPAASIPPLICQAFDYFVENYDGAVEERWFCLPNSEIENMGANNLFKLPPQIVSVFGCYKTSNNFNFGAMGDFSLERMLLNSAGNGLGFNNVNTFGTTVGYSLADVTGALYEISTYKELFDTPLTYNYNPYSNELVLLGKLGRSDLMLNVYKRVKLQDLYKNYYFFRYCVCLGMRSMGTIMGTFDFKLPGGISINYSQFADRAETEMERIHEWIISQRSADYFFNTTTI